MSTLNPLRFSAAPRKREQVARQAVHPHDAELNDLLSRWHEYRHGYRAARGHSGSNAACRDAGSGSAWDWINGAEEARAEQQIMRGVDAAVERVPDEPRHWRTAIHFEARNLHSGAAVWLSPHLPQNRAEREVLVMEARNRLMLELRKEGVMT